MSAQDAPQPRAVLAGGQDGSGAPRPPVPTQVPASGRLAVASIVAQGSAAEGPCGEGSATRAVAPRTAAGPWVVSSGWPGWAAAQLRGAVAIAENAPPGSSLAAHLYRAWFTYPLAVSHGGAPGRYAMPLAGVYRAAHAGSRRQVRVDGIRLVDRRDVIGADGWWRTWGRTWTPPRRRPETARIVFSPAPQRLAAVVRIVTGALLDSAQPWALACATNPRRVRRCAAVVLDLPSADALPAELLRALEPALLPQLPPLCLPLAPGVGLAGHPGNGMTFGEHRCHLISLALRRPGAADDPLQAIADVFRAHGIDPAAPHRYLR